MDFQDELNKTPPKEASTCRELLQLGRREYLVEDSDSNGPRRPHHDQRPPDRGRYPNRGGRPPD